MSNRRTFFPFPKRLSVVVQWHQEEQGSEGPHGNELVELGSHCRGTSLFSACPSKVKSPAPEEFVLAVSTIAVVFDRGTSLFRISSLPARSAAKGTGPASCRHSRGRP